MLSIPKHDGRWVMGKLIKCNSNQCYTALPLLRQNVTSVKRNVHKNMRFSSSQTTSSFYCKSSQIRELGNQIVYKLFIL